MTGMRPQGGTYSFLDVVVGYSGPAGSFDFSEGGISEEGVTVDFDEDKVSKTNGADGSWMYSLHAGMPGSIAIRLFKTSPLNAVMSRIFNFDTRSSANTGKGVITVRNPVSGDTFQAVGCALRRMPANANAKDGGMNEWVFMAGFIGGHLGDWEPTT
jgi:hypothetical protein